MFDWCLTCVATEDNPTAIYTPAPECCLSLYIQLLLTLRPITLTSTDVPPFWFLKHTPTTLAHILVSWKIIKQESKPENSKQILQITLYLEFSLWGIPNRTWVIKLYFASPYLDSVWYSHLTETVKQKWFWMQLWLCGWQHHLPGMSLYLLPATWHKLLYSY